MSQEELSFELGVSRQTIFKWEAGIRNPKAKNIEALCRYFNVSADYLLSEEPYESAQQEAKIISESEVVFGETAIVNLYEGVLHTFDIESPRKKQRCLWLTSVITASVVLAVSVLICVLFTVFNYPLNEGVQTVASDESVFWFYFVFVFVIAISASCLILLIFYRKRRKKS